MPKMLSQRRTSWKTCNLYRDRDRQLPWRRAFYERHPLSSKRESLQERATILRQRSRLESRRSRKFEPRVVNAALREVVTALPSRNARARRRHARRRATASWPFWQRPNATSLEFIRSNALRSTALRSTALRSTALRLTNVANASLYSAFFLGTRRRRHRLD